MNPQEALVELGFSSDRFPQAEPEIQAAYQTLFDRERIRMVSRDMAEVKAARQQIARLTDAREVLLTHIQQASLQFQQPGAFQQPPASEPVTRSASLDAELQTFEHSLNILLTQAKTQEAFEKIERFQEHLRQKSTNGQLDANLRERLQQLYLQIQEQINLKLKHCLVNAKNLEDSKDYPGALQAYREYIESLPSAPEGHIGVFSVQLKQLLDLQHFKNKLPSSEQLQNLEPKITKQRKLVQESQAAASRFGELSPYFHLYNGLYYQHDRKNFERAQKSFEQAAQLGLDTAKSYLKSLEQELEHYVEHLIQQSLKKAERIWLHGDTHQAKSVLKDITAQFHDPLALAVFHSKSERFEQAAKALEKRCTDQLQQKQTSLITKYEHLIAAEKFDDAQLLCEQEAAQVNAANISAKKLYSNLQAWIQWSKKARQLHLFLQKGEIHPAQSIFLDLQVHETERFSAEFLAQHIQPALSQLKMRLNEAVEAHVKAETNKFLQRIERLLNNQDLGQAQRVLDEFETSLNLPLTRPAFENYASQLSEVKLQITQQQVQDAHAKAQQRLQQALQELTNRFQTRFGQTHIFESWSNQWSQRIQEFSAEKYDQSQVYAWLDEMESSLIKLYYQDLENKYQKVLSLFQQRMFNHQPLKASVGVWTEQSINNWLEQETTLRVILDISKIYFNEIDNKVKHLPHLDFPIIFAHLGDTRYVEWPGVPESFQLERFLVQLKKRLKQQKMEQDLGYKIMNLSLEYDLNKTPAPAVVLFSRKEQNIPLDCFLLIQLSMTGRQLALHQQLAFLPIMLPQSLLNDKSLDAFLKEVKDTLLEQDADYQEKARQVYDNFVEQHYKPWLEKEQNWFLSQSRPEGVLERVKKYKENLQLKKTMEMISQSLVDHAMQYTVDEARESGQSRELWSEQKADETW